MKEKIILIIVSTVISGLIGILARVIYISIKKYADDIKVALTIHSKEIGKSLKTHSEEIEKAIELKLKLVKTEMKLELTSWTEFQKLQSSHDKLNNAFSGLRELYKNDLNTRRGK